MRGVGGYPFPRKKASGLARLRERRFSNLFFQRQQDDIYIRLEGKQVDIHLDACIQVDI